MRMPMLSPSCGLSRCGEYGGALLFSATLVKRRCSMPSMAKSLPGSIGRRCQFTPAVVAEDVEQRIAGREVLVDHVGAPDLERLALAQHQQAGGVVDLPVHQHDGADAGVADAAAGLQRGKALICASTSGEALNSTQSTPLLETAIEDCVRGMRANAALAHAVAIAAIAVPLRETAARCSSEDANAHESAFCVAQ